MINGHGDDLYQYSTDIRYNFSSNVYFEGCSPLLIEHLKSNLNLIENYPSPIASELTTAASHHHDLPSNHFLFTNGATEAFYLIAKLFENSSATIFHPTFAEYEDSCNIHNIQVTNLPINDLTEIIISTKLAFICNPNNPDGSVHSVKTITKLLADHPETTFIIDEAYMEFTTATSSCLQLTTKFDNLLITKSLTKTFVIPGLRIGYLVGSPSLISKLLAYKMPWSVNALAIQAGKFIFQHYESLKFDIHTLLAQSKAFQTKLNTLPTIRTIPSHCSYFLIELKHKKARETKEKLVQDHQILVRDASNFRMLGDHFIRVSTQSEVAQTALYHALKEITE